MPSTKADYDGDGQQHHSRQGGTGGHCKQPEHGRNRAREPEAAGARQATVLLTTGVVHAAS
jgi:hypothetical protein